MHDTCAAETPCTHPPALGGPFAFPPFPLATPPMPMPAPATAHTHRHTQTYTDTQTHRHTDTQTHRHTDTSAICHIYTHTSHTHTHTGVPYDVVYASHHILHRVHFEGNQRTPPPSHAPEASFGGLGSPNPHAWNHDRWSSTCAGSNSSSLKVNALY